MKRAYAKQGEKYTIYYLIDTEKKSVKCFSTTDTCILSGTYTGTFEDGICICYTGQNFQESITFKDKSAIVIDSKGFDWEFFEVDVSIAEQILRQPGYHDIASY